MCRGVQEKVSNEGGRRIEERQNEMPFYTPKCLVEQWRHETHTFYLSVGEETVTLEDVTYILGLSVNGEPVTGRIEAVTSFWWRTASLVLVDSPVRTITS
ncbi:hypothetical protein AHAS_Ahas10G0094200 [Arachis hypogaea]